MLGACGAILCMTAGAALGVALREYRYNRLRLLENEVELLARLRLMLLEERFGLCQLLRECAAGDEGVFAKRLRQAANGLEEDPLTGLCEAYQAACRVWPLRCEQTEEKQALGVLFAQLGAGTASMREQAVASTLRRLKPLTESARANASRGGRLFLQLGLLLGLMAGIALW